MWHPLPLTQIRCGQCVDLRTRVSTRSAASPVRLRLGTVARCARIQRMCCRAFPDAGHGPRIAVNAPRILRPHPHGRAGSIDPISKFCGTRRGILARPDIHLSTLPSIGDVTVKREMSIRVCSTRRRAWCTSAPATCRSCCQDPAFNVPAPLRFHEDARRNINIGGAFQILGGARRWIPTR